MRITVQWYSAVVFSVQTVPTLFCFSGSLVVRSGLMARPGLAEIGRLEHHVAAEVDRVVVVRREHDGRVPVEAVLQLAHRTAVVAPGLRADVLLLARAQIGAHDAAALAFREIQPRLVEMVDHVESVAAAHVGPVAVEDAALVVAAGPGPASVVLQAAREVVERLAVVGEHLVELADRDVADPFPVFGAIVADGDAAVLSLPDAVGILGIDPHGVIVAVGGGRDETRWCGRRRSDMESRMPMV